MPKPRKNAEPLDEWVSLPQAAKLLGLQRLKVLQLALKGALVSDIRGKWTFISRESIDRYLEPGA